MKEIIQFESYEVEIWRRPRQRSLRLTVQHGGRVRVTCNRRCAKRDVLAFVRDSKDFIEKRLRELTALECQFPARRCLSGETWLFKGELLTMELVWTWGAAVQVRTLDGVIEVKAPLQSPLAQRAQALENFYRGSARAHIHDRLRNWVERTGLKPKSLSIRGQKTRWGSCSARGEISLNWKLMALPETLIDYVIVHELCHLVHMNHSPDFWSLVGRWLPDYKASRLRLKKLEPEVAAQFRFALEARS